MNPLRELLPQPQTATSASADVRPRVDPPASTRPIPRRPSRQRKPNTACDPCRKRKTRCDGGLPKCLMCEHRGESCAYTYSVRHSVTVTEGADASKQSSGGMLEALRTLPNQQAVDLLHKFRYGSESPSQLPSRLSEQRFLRALLPPTQNSLEFELALRHSVAYPTLFPVSYTDTPLGLLLKPMAAPRPRQKQDASPNHDLESESAPTGKQQFGHADETGVDTQTDKGDLEDTIRFGPLFDERLQMVDIANWTPVPISNELAISVLSHYFDIDYPIFPFFDADLFIRDLVEVRSYFCSSFLVNSLLCWACKALTPLHSDCAALSLLLYEQAERDYTNQTQPNTLTTVSALQLLGMTAVTLGEDDMSRELIKQSVRLGRLMGLFDANSEAESAGYWVEGYKDWTRAASYTAWGVFNWVTLVSMHYHTIEIETPPSLPKPRDIVGGSHAEDTDSIEAARTVRRAQVFSASTDLWIIIKDVLQEYYRNETADISRHASLEFAEEVYHRLLDWANSLPLDLARCKESSHDVMMMHIYFHAAVTDLFRPFLASHSRTRRLGSFSSAFASPEAVYAASVNQLKRLFLLYRLRYTTARLSVLWQTAVVYVANAMIREAGQSVGHHDAPAGKECNFYLDLCLSGLQDLYVSFPTSGFIAQGMVGMALRHAAILPAKAKRVLKQLKEQGEVHADAQLKNRAEAQWVLDLDLAMTDRYAAQGRSLVHQLEILMLTEDPTADESMPD